MIQPPMQSAAPQLGSYSVEPDRHSVSGLSSGAFMAVQLHLAHSGKFVGAGVIAGGPYRCVETFRQAAAIAEDACLLNALYIAMTPLTAATAPNGRRLAELARRTPDIDPVENIAAQRIYIFTGTRDKVVHSVVVRSTRDFYLALGVAPENLLFVDDEPAGHSILTSNFTDSPEGANIPPYINFGGYMQSHTILKHIYPDLAPPVEHASGELICFDQTEFLGRHDAARASLSPFGYVYVPSRVKQGGTARAVHVALHGCKQGYGYVSFTGGLSDRASQPPYGTRYVTTTGYNEIAESNDIIVLYPQALGTDDAETQNPDGCWDWWGYTSRNPEALDFYTRSAVQIRAIDAMLDRLCGTAAAARSKTLAEAAE